MVVMDHFLEDLDYVTDHSLEHGTWGVRHNSSFIPMYSSGRDARHDTSFAVCYLPRITGVPGMSGLPCRSNEEESCNEVRAFCARTLKQMFVPSLKELGDAIPGNYCPEATPDEPTGAAGRRAAAMRDIAESVAEKVSPCNARMVDMPYGMTNPEAWKDNPSLVSGTLHPKDYAKRPVVEQNPSETLWGMAVHGRAGTPFFDSWGHHAVDYIYRIPQKNGAEDDYYLCDDRNHPRLCALLGGNLRNACAANYDPFTCNYCQDHGDTLTCHVHGWNYKLNKWVKVPIYPRDVLGELYPGEWEHVENRPQYASITIPKEAFRNFDVKEMPGGLVADSGPGKTIPPDPLAKIPGLSTIPGPWQMSVDEFVLITTFIAPISPSPHKVGADGASFL